ncbi:hypothetical protein NPIL_7291 [Nephila pilipes]|uniref:Uncharacterized protein n=1 Tax=Nephila pilipes TaxID=299642 RepID=A0A8X6TYT8_NEPPI|nr:hypothetical protein NPIL_7291 [Nephila pilipes]
MLDSLESVSKSSCWLAILQSKWRQSKQMRHVAVKFTYSIVLEENKTKGNSVCNRFGRYVYLPRAALFSCTMRLLRVPGCLWNGSDVGNQVGYAGACALRTDCLLGAG